MSKKTKPKATGATSDPDLVPLTVMDQEKRAAKKPKAKGEKAVKPAKAPKAKPERIKKVSCLDAAAQVLKTEGKPMNCKAMIEAMFHAKLWTTDAPTPAATLYSAILREMTTKGSAGRFKKTERGMFTLA